MSCKNCGGKFGMPSFVKKVIKWRKSFKLKTKPTTDERVNNAKGQRTLADSGVDSFGG